MENPISITSLNDFIFCPVSIYFHLLDYDTSKTTYQSDKQISGSIAHKSIDKKNYSDRKCIYQGIPVYCDKYNLIGKIDIYNSLKHELVERKKKITKIYDGYVFQLYAQYFSLIEMGFEVKEIKLYSLDDNKTYLVDLPENNKELFSKFLEVMDKIRKFNFNDFIQENNLKCRNCIYEPLCSYSEGNI